MARRKGLIHGGMTVDEAVAEGLLNRILAKDVAAKKYVLKYKTSNPKFAGWLLFMEDYLEKHRDELLRLPNKERATKVMDLVAEARREWMNLPEDERAKWIERAKHIIGAYKDNIEREVKIADELEKLATEAYKGIEELATVMS